MEKGAVMSGHGKASESGGSGKAKRHQREQSGQKDKPIVPTPTTTIDLNSLGPYFRGPGPGITEKKHHRESDSDE